MNISFDPLLINMVDSAILDVDHGKPQFPYSWYLFVVSIIRLNKKEWSNGSVIVGVSHLLRNDDKSILICWNSLVFVAGLCFYPLLGRLFFWRVKVRLDQLEVIGGLFPYEI